MLAVKPALNDENSEKRKNLPKPSIFPSLTIQKTIQFSLKKNPFRRFRSSFGAKNTFERENEKNPNKFFFKVHLMRDKLQLMR